MSDYLQGLILGLAYVAPIGMQNLFVINTAAAGTLSRRCGRPERLSFLILPWLWVVFWA